MIVLSQRDGEIRLLGSNLTFEGRVEIYHANKWGTICDDYWGKEEANVVCHQRNYTLGAQYWYSNAHFGEGKDPIWLDDVMCVGNETALTDCKHNGWKGHNCHHYEDVGVVCVKEGRQPSLYELLYNCFPCVRPQTNNSKISIQHCSTLLSSAC